MTRLWTKVIQYGVPAAENRDNSEAAAGESIGERGAI